MRCARTATAPQCIGYQGVKVALGSEDLHVHRMASRLSYWIRSYRCQAAGGATATATVCYARTAICVGARTRRGFEQVLAWGGAGPGC